MMAMGMILPAAAVGGCLDMDKKKKKSSLIMISQFPTWSFTPNTSSQSHHHRRKPTYSLLDDTASASTTAAEIELNSAVKNKAEDIASPLRGTSIYLVGINNKMKTSLGKFIAETLRYYFFDSDKLIEEVAGGAAAAKSIRERDDKGFRESETEVLKQLSSMGRLVVSSGNGVFDSPTNLSLLRHGILIWIDIPLEMIAKEAVEDGLQLSSVELSPPASYPEVLDQLTALYKQMQGGYATADATISLQKLAQRLGYDALDAVTVEHMGLEVLKEIEKLMRVKKLMEEAARPF